MGSCNYKKLLQKKFHKKSFENACVKKHDWTVTEKADDYWMGDKELVNK